MLMRHEGIYGDRYKLIHHCDVAEWSLMDMQRDSHALTRMCSEVKYRGTIARLKRALAKRKKEYLDSPRAPSSTDDQRFLPICLEPAPRDGTGAGATAIGVTLQFRRVFAGH